jgi:nucleoid-associated protein YgaU
MKLKEAQMLGVLALIAVGIILLCMWGGHDKAKAPAAGTEQTQAGAQPAMEPDLAQLYNDLLDKQPSASATAGHDATASMAIGGTTPAPVPAASESNSLSSLIESVKASQIPLTPPAAAQTTASAPAAPGATVTHVVQSGETLSSISKKYYGSPNDWRVILDANSSVVKDARDLRPNMRLVIPAQGSKTASAPAKTAQQPSVLSATAPRPGAAVVPAAAATSSTVRTHLVAKGDTLFRIALKYYGDGSRYKDVLAANRSTLSQPQDLRPGMKLVIP